jgi:hypothetical protein
MCSPYFRTQTKKKKGQHLSINKNYKCTRITLAVSRHHSSATVLQCWQHTGPTTTAFWHKSTVRDSLQAQIHFQIPLYQTCLSSSTFLSFTYFSCCFNYMEFSFSFVSFRRSLYRLLLTTEAPLFVRCQQRAALPRGAWLLAEQPCTVTAGSNPLYFLLLILPTLWCHTATWDAIKNVTRYAEISTANKVIFSK